MSGNCPIMTRPQLCFPRVTSTTHHSIYLFIFFFYSYCNQTIFCSAKLLKSNSKNGSPPTLPISVIHLLLSKTFARTFNWQSLIFLLHFSCLAAPNFFSSVHAICFIFSFILFFQMCTVISVSTCLSTCQFIYVCGVIWDILCNFCVFSANETQGSTFPRQLAFFTRTLE